MLRGFVFTKLTTHSRPQTDLQFHPRRLNRPSTVDFLTSGALLTWRHPATRRKPPCEAFPQHPLPLHRPLFHCSGGFDAENRFCGPGRSLAPRGNLVGYDLPHLCPQLEHCNTLREVRRQEHRGPWTMSHCSNVWPSPGNTNIMKNARKLGLPTQRGWRKPASYFERDIRGGIRAQLRPWELKKLILQVVGDRKFALRRRSSISP